MSDANNIKFNLPFRGPGDVYSGYDFDAIQRGYDDYEVKVHGRNSINYGAAAIGGGVGAYSASYNPHNGNSFRVDAKTMKYIIDGVSLPHLGLSRTSNEEIEELESLESELLKWKKQEQLNKFKLLPTHIRQEIVDEAIVNNLVNSQPSDDEFEDITRLRELRGKINPQVLRYSHDNQSTLNSLKLKYEAFINKFTTNELMEAHIEASLEDEIVN